MRSRWWTRSRGWWGGVGAIATGVGMIVAGVQNGDWHLIAEGAATLSVGISAVGIRARQER